MNGVYAFIADPGFPAPPWPGKRRLGPFDTVQEAEGQIASDIAIGHLAEDAFLGIHDDEDSTALEIAETAEVTDHTDRSRIAGLVAERRASLSDGTARRLRETQTRVAGLPDGHEGGGLIKALIDAGALPVSDDELAKLREVGLA